MAQSMRVLAVVAISVAVLGLSVIGVYASPRFQAAPLGYQLVETVVVPGDGSVVFSNTVLAAGVNYKLEAIGLDPGVGDAEYDWGGNDICTWGPGNPYIPITDIGVGINDTVVDDKKMPFWGPFNPSHVYMIDHIGEGGTISINFHDCIYGDNRGGISVRIYAPLFIPVNVDIKPDDYPNAINPRNNGVIPVAILTSETFDATTVDPLSVEFGPNDATEAHGRGHIEDVDGDGDLDMLLHFRTQDAAIQCGDTTASLTGMTVNGMDIEGSDSIVTVGCK